MTSRMPERARTDPREPWGSNPLGPPGPELPILARYHLLPIAGVDVPEVVQRPGTEPIVSN
jgi:hypothetical protein